MKFTRPARYALLAITIPMVLIGVWLLLLPVLAFTPGDPIGKGYLWFFLGALLFGLALAAFIVFLSAALINLIFYSKGKPDEQ